MNPHISAFTLAVNDVGSAREFYTHCLAYQVGSELDGFVSLRLGEGSSALGLCGWEVLAADGGVPADSSGFRAFTLSYILDRADQVDAVMAAARQAGARIGKPARNGVWGGYSGYFTDPDGYLWKVASNKRRRGSPRTSQLPVVRPKETAVTLGVRDFREVRNFYSEGLGCPVGKSFGSFASFSLGDGSSVLGLYKRAALAKDAGVSTEGSGFHGFTLSCIVASGEQVDQMLAKAARAGGKISKPAQATPRGGYYGYFADPDGNLWKVAAA